MSFENIYNKISNSIFKEIFKNIDKLDNLFHQTLYYRNCNFENFVLNSMHEVLKGCNYIKTEKSCDELVKEFNNLYNITANMIKIFKDDDFNYKVLKSLLEWYCKVKYDDKKFKAYMFETYYVNLIGKFLSL